MELSVKNEDKAKPYVKDYIEERGGIHAILNEKNTNFAFWCFETRILCRFGRQQCAYVWAPMLVGGKLLWKKRKMSKKTGKFPKFSTLTCFLPFHTNNAMRGG